jgi:hypothetical protein
VENIRTSFKQHQHLQKKKTWMTAVLTKMLSYFSLFTWSLFPPAALLIALLILPFPHKVNRAVVGLCDAVLFWNPHPSIPGLSLFWLVFLIGGITFLAVLEELKSRVDDYYTHKTERGLVSLLAAERNAWISGCFTTLWVILHRYRSLLKKYHNLREQVKPVQQQQQPVVYSEVVKGSSSGTTANSTPSNNNNDKKTT